MKITILAMAATMAIAGTAVAQTNGSSAMTSPSSTTTTTNSPDVAGDGPNSRGATRRSMPEMPSNGATGAASQNGTLSEPGTSATVNGAPASPGQKNGSGKAGGGSK
ncbi:MAG TPA: hypothetical protein VKQ27_19685 [Acetobacteraceae bacterium]|nr:hypothetical protein [Acetobacteraceae bacterium]